MKILLIDLDVHPRRRAFPNLALMKWSRYHRDQGDQVVFNSPLEATQPDRVYASCVFTWNRKALDNIPRRDNLYVGGIGVPDSGALPPNVEHLMPDYDLYPNIDFSLGFTSRGCNRRCKFCKVPDKEGAPVAWSRVGEFWDRRHSKIRLLDNNLLAAPNWEETLADLTATGCEIDFNQGLDIRLVTPTIARSLANMRTKKLRFAFDSLSYVKGVRRGINTLLRAGVSPSHLSFYVLTGFTEDDAVIERMKILAEYGVDVYPMIYRDEDGKEPGRRIIYDGDIFWHGGRNNISKFLRLVGRLPA